MTTKEALNYFKNEHDRVQSFSFTAKDAYTRAVEAMEAVVEIEDDIIESELNLTAAKAEMEIYEQAVELWGEKAQILVAIEEMAELTQALLKYLRYGACTNVLANVNEERADVEIMLNQLAVMFGDCSEWQYRKLCRLEGKLKEEKEYAV